MVFIFKSDRFTRNQLFAVGLGIFERVRDLLELVSDDPRLRDEKIVFELTLYRQIPAERSKGRTKIFHRATITARVNCELALAGQAGNQRLPANKEEIRKGSFVFDPEGFQLINELGADVSSDDFILKRSLL